MWVIRIAIIAIMLTAAGVLSILALTQLAGDGG
jgi:hypothetical protein